MLLLHGGGAREVRAVSAAQPSVLRMWIAAAAAVRAARGELVVARVLNSTRGWGGSSPTPVDDAAWALDQVVKRFGPLPVALVGHSLGARAALQVAGRDEVRSVAALAPWVQPGDGRAASGCRVLVLHGDRDRVAPIGRAEAVARELEARNEVSFVRLPGAGHALVRESRQVDPVAAAFSRAAVLGEPWTAPSGGS